MRRQDANNSYTELLSAVLNDRLFYLCILALLSAWLLVNAYVLNDRTDNDLSQVFNRQAMQMMEENPKTTGPAVPDEDKVPDGKNT